MSIQGITVANLVTAVEHAMGEVAGSGVQVYAEPLITEAIGQTLRMLMRKYPWQEYQDWSRHELDGTLGIVNADAFSTVMNFHDFTGMFIDGRKAPLPHLPHNLNPYTLGTGTTPLCWSSLAVTDTNFLTRRLQVWPKTATGFINVSAKVYPSADELNDDTILYLDRDMLTHGVAWMLLEDEGTNQAAATKHQLLFDVAYKDVTAALAMVPLISGNRPTGSSWPTTWQTQ